MDGPLVGGDFIALREETVFQVASIQSQYLQWAHIVASGIQFSFMLRKGSKWCRDHGLYLTSSRTIDEISCNFKEYLDPVGGRGRGRGFLMLPVPLNGKF